MKDGLDSKKMQAESKESVLIKSFDIGPQLDGYGALPPYPLYDLTQWNAISCVIRSELSATHGAVKSNCFAGLSRPDASGSRSG